MNLWLTRSALTLSFRSVRCSSSPLVFSPLPFTMSNPRKRPHAAISTAASAMMDASDFDRINAEMASYDKKREDVIKRSRDIQKMSKNSIFSLHRGDIERGSQQIVDALKIVSELMPVIKENPTLRPGSFANSLEELAEAQCFMGYIQDNRLIRQSELGFESEAEEYLGGVLDFTGELNRLAVIKATARDVEAVQRARDLVEGLMGQFLQFDLRNGSLRKKYDSLKYVLKNLESTLYDLSLSGAGGFKPSAAKQEDIPNGKPAGGDGDGAEAPAAADL